MRNIFAIIAAACLAAAFSGCSNYRLAGTATNLPFSSVYVQPVRNVSFAPQAAPILTNAISKALMQVPDLRVAYQSEAQAVLSTTIVDYEKVPIATKERDTALAASYRITATASCTLMRSNGQVVFKDRPVRAFITVYTGANDNLISNEYESMPVLMRELGDKITDAVIGIW